MTSDLTRSFVAHDLEPAEFGHAEHVQVAFELLSEHDFMEAASIYSTGIRTLAGNAGVPQKFNVTITLAFLSLIAERIENMPGASFDEFVDQNQDLMSKNVLAAWYAPDRLLSDTARSIFLLPQPPQHSGNHAPNSAH